MHTESVVARRRMSDSWRTCYSNVACTLQAIRRGVQDTQRSGLKPVLIYCSMHTGRVAICAAQTRRFRCAWALRFYSDWTRQHQNDGVSIV